MNETLGGILVVADSGIINETLVQTLFSLAQRVMIVNEAKQALALAEADPFDLILFAARLPDMMAQEFLRRIKDTDSTNAAATIVIGSPDQDMELEQCLRAGADDFLITPISEGLLKARARFVLEHKRLRHKHESSIESAELLKIEHDIQVARRIQAGFLPTELPKPRGWDVAACFQPAREVAGDFYDAFMLSQNRRLGFVIADVVDKGVPAALFMALVRSLTRAFAQQNYSINWTDILEAGTSAQLFTRRQTRAIPSTGTMALKNAVQLTNNYITENHMQDNMFATLFFGMLDPATGQLAYINAGHNPPVIFDGNGNLKLELKPTSMAVGMMPDTNYSIEFAQIDPGDFIFCYTDGVTEARNAGGDFFMENRLFELLARQGTTARGLVDHVYAALQDFMTGAVQFDDITMIAVVRQPEVF
ncbi:MAG: PP2C family protein-serine/threonine phosphatase [Candidatus Contendobacter sp.]|nr:PP2C family protein-serine/threonine phosphatase [Candidatus Contendobacter sp.]MDG4558264.1 PP2C family protein-serine/threonine phosphatase [Candidatus Contendobacter sp.]